MLLIGRRNKNILNCTATPTVEEKQSEDSQVDRFFTQAEDFLYKQLSGKVCLGSWNNEVRLHHATAGFVMADTYLWPNSRW